MSLGINRTAYDFIVEIVKTCQEPVTKTRLYYKMGTSYGIVDRWLKKARALKLVEKKSNKYYTTDKGINFLNTWAEIQKFLREDKLSF